MFVRSGAVIVLSGVGYCISRPPFRGGHGLPLLKRFVSGTAGLFGGDAHYRDAKGAQAHQAGIRVLPPDKIVDQLAESVGLQPAISSLWSCWE